MGFLRGLFKRKSEPEPEILQLAQTISSFIQTDTWAQSCHFVQTHPELLANEAMFLLEKLMVTAQKSGDDNARRIFAEHLALLRRCREIGTVAAFAEKMGEQMDARSVSQKDNPFIPPQFEADMQQAEMNEQRYVQRGDERGLDDAAAAWERILQHPTFPQTNSRFQLAMLNNSAIVFIYRYQVQGQLADLTRALQLWQMAVQRTPPDSPDLPGYLNNLGNGLHDRYARTGQLADLEEAIRVCQQAVQLTPRDSPDLSSFLNTLGNGLSDRYAHTGQLADLEEAIRVRQQTVQLTRRDSPDLPGYLNNLGNILGYRYARIGQMADLEEAIRVCQQAVQRTPRDSPDLPGYLNNLGNGLRDRYARTGQLADLEEAIRVCQTAVQRTPPDSPALPSSLNNLGNGLRDRYARTGQLADLEEAIRMYQTAVQRTPPHTPDLPSSLNNLGSGLRDRYARTGQLADLEEAIRMYQTTVQLTPLDSPDLSMYLNNLGGGFQTRYVRTGQLADLEEAIRVYQAASQRTLPGSPGLPRILNNLGFGLRTRYARTGQLADLEAGIAASQEAVQRTPSDSPDLPMYLNNLGFILRTCYARTRQLADLEKVIRVCQMAVQRTPPDSPALPSRLNNLGTGLSDHYAHTGQLADLEEAIGFYETAVQRTPPDSPHLSGYLTNLGIGLGDRYACTGQLADLEEAIRTWRDACQRGLGIDRGAALMAARTWGRSALVRHAWEEGSEAYAIGLAALEQLYKAQALRQDRQSWQKDAPDLVINAAYALVRTNQLEQAVMVLEQGRARGLHESLARDQADLRDLQQDAPELFAAYEDAAGRLHKLEAVERQQQIGWESNTPPPDWSAHRQQVAEATQRLDEAIARIRQLPNHATFLTPPDFTAVTAAVQPDTPLLYLVTTAVGSLGLLVQQAPPTSTKTVTITPIWADTFTEADLNIFLVQQDDGQVTGGYLPGQLGQTAWLQASLANGLPQFGEKLMGPIAARLHDLDPDLKQVTLIPTGRLSLLPLHAAHYLQDGQETTFIDRFTVSYAPSAQVLAHSQQKMAQNGADELPWLLAVGNPLPSSKCSLPFARLEAEQIAGFFPGKTHLFCETAAHYEAVTAHLPQAAYLHFSCHGTFDVNQPLASGLLLSDDRLLTLADILDQFSLTQARLVVLSACKTAVTDFQNVPDEVVGLPAGFLQAGVPGVVGSLWLADDLPTMLLMHRFYKLFLANARPLPPAEALCQAQLWLRMLSIGEVVVSLESLYQVTPRMAQPALLKNLNYFRLQAGRDSQLQPFAHPYFWAAFLCMGC